MVKKILAHGTDILEFLKKRKIVSPYELSGEFSYTSGYVRVVLSRLKKAGLITNTMKRGCWELTEEGYKKLSFLEARRIDSAGQSKAVTDLEERAKTLEKEKVALEEQLKREKSEKEVQVERLKREKSSLEEQLTKLNTEKSELEEQLKIFLMPAQAKEEVPRLLKEVEVLVDFYNRAPKLGVRPEQFDWKELTSRIDKLLKLSPFLPPEEREKLLQRLAGGGGRI